jgi:hypothetical protein
MQLLMNSVQCFDYVDYFFLFAMVAPCLFFEVVLFLVCVVVLFFFHGGW